MKIPWIKYIITKWYYVLTPLFIVADYVFDLNIRVSVFEAYPLYKNIYYGFCVVCGISVIVWPLCTPVIALCESVINFVITVLSIFMPYFLLLGQAEDILIVDFDVFDKYRFTNLILAGGIALLAYKQSSKDIESIIQKRLSEATKNQQD